MKSKMTEGKIFSKLLLFALPLVIGSIFQLTYNLFDYIILGWFSDNPIFISFISLVLNISSFIFAAPVIPFKYHAIWLRI